MKKTLSIIVVLLLACHCFSQEKEQQKSAFKYSVGLAYNQIWLQSNLYGADEYGVSSSPFNWGITPYFSMAKGRLVLSSGINYSSCSRTKKYYSDYFETLIHQDKWKETSLISSVGFRVTSEHSFLKVTTFLGIDLSYLINYEKTVITDIRTKHYNTDELWARNCHDTYVWNDVPIPLGLDLLCGINVSCPIAKHFDIGISYFMKFKIINNIRNFHDAHYPDITSPVFYHTANIGVSYRFN